MTNLPIDHEPIDENDLFFFESDHLALRGNKDYSDMLKAIFALESQRQQAIEDYNRVFEIKKQCLEDPLACVDKLRTSSLDIPELQKIADIPRINWSKFNVKIPEHYMKQVNADKFEAPVKDVKHNRLKPSSTPWTIEEQRKLEGLLVKYPPEEVESKRIKKIATEIGTRTFAQVASRLQKYYLKLLKEGLPIPGKLPKSKSYDKKLKGKNKGKCSYTKLMKRSTFFPDLDIPVMMNEHEEVPGPSSSAMTEPPSANTNNYLLPNIYQEDKKESLKDDVELQLDLVKRIKAEKEIECLDLSQCFQHYGYKCDYCDEDPIEGSRWHCSSCVSSSVDYCTDCMLSQLCSSNPHPLQHKYIIVRSDKEVVDSIYSDSESVLEGSTKNADSWNESTEDTDSDYEEKSESGSTSNFNDTPRRLISDENEMGFTETQNESYSYLHSSLLMDDS